MANVFDYLRWRGDLRFTQDPPNCIDALIFSSIVYIRFDGSAVSEPEKPLQLKALAEELCTLPDFMQRGRNKNDIDLLIRMAAAKRYENVSLVHYRQRYLPEEETQFAAMTFLLDDGSMFLSFRGTDNTVTGWKEDFNMCFRKSVPAQLLAQRYLQEMLAEYTRPVHLCGHSKGGNLAVYAAAKSPSVIQQQILDVYNNDGPGFTEYMMGDPGYKKMVPKIHTFVPQSSVIGLLMKHEEPFTIVHSTQVSLLQHDTFSWEVLGKEFVCVEEITRDSAFLDFTLDKWLSEMDMEERSRWVDALFQVINSVDSDHVSDLFLPKNLRKILKRIGENGETQQILAAELINLLEAAKQSRGKWESHKGKANLSADK